MRGKGRSNMEPVEVEARRWAKLPPYLAEFSWACWDALEKMKWELRNGQVYPTGLTSTEWIHLQDALQRGTVTPMECYDAISLGYCPEHLKVRDSAYAHLLKP